METWKIRDIIPGKASEETQTPGRRFLQVIFEPVADEGYLVTKRRASRNFWEEWLGGKTSDGFNLDIAADQLYLSICDSCAITSDNIDQIDWVEGSDAFSVAIGKKVKGDLVHEYVEPYPIPGSLSKSSMRYTYTTIVLDGEDKYQVFRNQGHVIPQDHERIEEIKRMAYETAKINEEAREDRQRRNGTATVGERTGTGAVTTERSLGGAGMSAQGGEDPAINRDPDRKKPKI